MKIISRQNTKIREKCLTNSHFSTDSLTNTKFDQLPIQPTLTIHFITIYIKSLLNKLL
jgi:hypothetical protein